MKAMILGGVAPHIELIRILKEKGYTTILADYLENPPAAEYADVFYRISTLDKEAVLELAKKEQIDLIMSVAVDHANITVCYVAEKLGLPMPYSMETAEIATDKSKMKAVMKANDIPTSDYIVLKKGDPVPEGIVFPAVVKPVDNNGSKGIRKVENYEQVHKYIGEAFSFTRKGEVIIEGFNAGMEIQVDCFANQGKAHVLMVREKLGIPRKEGLAMQSIGSMTPARVSAEVDRKINEIAENIVKGFKLEHTPFFYQAIVNGDDIKVLELSPRIGGGLSYKMLKRQTDFNVMETIAASYFGNVENVSFQRKQQYMLTRILYGQNGTFDHMTGIEEAEKEGLIEDFDRMIEKGKVLGETLDSRNRIGAYFIIDTDPDRLNEKAAKARDLIDALDPEGHSILCKELYK